MANISGSSLIGWIKLLWYIVLFGVVVLGIVHILLPLFGVEP